MNISRFIAQRLNFFDKKNKSIARPVINIVTLGIALSLCVMILSVAVVTGFKSAIKEKVTGFASHIQISNLDNNSSFETYPIEKRISGFTVLKQVENIDHIQAFATKPGIIKTGEEIQGVVLHGIDSNFKWDFFLKNLQEGIIFTIQDSIKSNQILISKTLSDLLKINVNDDVYMHFVQEPPRMRKFKVAGIYYTGMAEFDRYLVLCDIKHVQKLNGWNENQISGYDIFLHNFSQINKSEKDIYSLVGNRPDSLQNMLKVEPVTQKYSFIFDWLELVDVNVWLILILMLIVAGFNMISGLLVLILEKTNFIGILKSLGMTNWSIRKIFLYQSAYIIGKGMLWGNILAITICLIQLIWGVISLNPELYYIDKVPINLKIGHILALNAGTLLLILLIMIIPSWLITKISPVKAIRFD